MTSWMLDDVPDFDVAEGEDRIQINGEIPHGWKLVPTMHHNEWAMSRVINGSVSTSLLQKCSALRALLKPEEDDLEGDVVLFKSRYGSPWSWLTTPLLKDVDPPATLMYNMLRVAQGTGLITIDVLSDEGESMGMIDPPTVLEDDLLSSPQRVMQATDIGLYNLSDGLAMLPVLVGPVTLKSVKTLKATILDQGWPIHPVFDGTWLKRNAVAMVVSAICIRMLRNVCKPIHELRYDLHRINEYWLDRASMLHLMPPLQSCKAVRDALHPNDKPVRNEKDAIASTLFDAVVMLCGSYAPVTAPTPVTLQDNMFGNLEALVYSARGSTLSGYIQDHITMLRSYRNGRMMYFQYATEDGETHLLEDEDAEGFYAVIHRLQKIVGKNLLSSALTGVEVLPAMAFVKKLRGDLKTLIPHDLLVLLLGDQDLANTISLFRTIDVNKTALRIAPRNVWEGQQIGWMDSIVGVATGDGFDPDDTSHYKGLKT